MFKNWVESAKLLGAEGRSLLLGLAPEQKAAIDSLGRPGYRTFLEALLKELTGRDWTVKLSVVEGLAAALETPRPNDKRQSFKDDPLIQEALEIFEGEIKSVTT